MEYSNYNPNNRKIYYLIFGTCFVLSALLVAQLNPPAYSSIDAYDSGYDHGCDDAGISNPDNRYINQPEKGQLFILAGLWMDTMTALMPVLEQMTVRLYQHRQAPVKVKASQAQARARADFLQNVAL